MACVNRWIAAPDDRHPPLLTDPLPGTSQDPEACIAARSSVNTRPRSRAAWARARRR